MYSKQFFKTKKREKKSDVKRRKENIRENKKKKEEDASAEEWKYEINNKAKTFFFSFSICSEWEERMLHKS